ncbi:MAG: T9SS type A sorting domain-containing protein, partial [Candidatus Cloacimonetes bacterium]|nr:T9SS type A sorting domain-containing protein [Candidatus Cloacimonadota bacterium]
MNKLQSIVILGVIMCLLYSPFLFAGEDEQKTPASMTTSSVGFAVEDYDFLSRTGLFYEDNDLTGFKPYSKTSNLRDSLNVEFVGRGLYGPPMSVFIRDTLAFVGTEAAILIFDIRDSLEPSLLGHVPIHLAMAFDIYVTGEYAYVSQLFMPDSRAGIQIVDISDPTAPHEVSYYETDGYILGVYATSDYLYACLSIESEPFNGLLILDVSDPANPSEVNFLDFGGGPFGYWTQEVEVVGNYAYVASCSNGLKIVDVSDPTAPNVVGAFISGDGCNRDVQVSGDYAYLTFDYMGEVSLVITNISNPTQPQQMGACGLSEGSIKFYIAGNYAYVARQEGYGEGGLLIISISDPANPFEVGSCDTEGSPFKIDGDVGFAYLAAGSGGLVVADVSDVSVPIPVADWYTGSIAHSVEVVGNYAYIADYNYWASNYTARGALRIVDISDPVSPTIVGSFRSDAQCKEISVQLPYAYIGDDEGGLRIVDVSDPTNPTEMGYYNTPDFYAYGLDVVGEYVYLCGCIEDIMWEDSLFILDISDPTNPFVTGACDVKGSRVFVDGNYAYVANRQGMFIIDVSNPEAPFEVGHYPTQGSPTAPTYEIYVVEDLAYIADGTGGLRIVDVSDPANPVEMSNLATSGPARSIYVAGNFAYLGTMFIYGGIPCVEVIDISDTYNPVMIGYYDLYNIVYDVYVESDLVYVANGTCGFYILQYTGGVGIEGDNLFVPTSYSLSQNYPNPFNPETTISFSVTQTLSFVNLEIYNIKGQKVKTVINEHYSKGTHSVVWNGKDENNKPVSSGIYFYKLKTENYEKTKKMILL